MREKLLILLSLTIIAINRVSSAHDTSFKIESVEQIHIHELFTLMIKPTLFNFSNSLSNEQIRYRPSLLGRPSLPSWMNFQFSKERNLGYLYGSATEKYANREIKIEIIALNKLTYETQRVVIPFRISFKPAPMNRIEMKITNYNWEHMTDMGRVKNLKGIFMELWPESYRDLSIVFMESAVRLGARLPLKPSNREGVIVHLGSNAQLSSRLIELDQEIKPLSKLSTCTFKRTKVQQIFQSAGFMIDWCAFKIITQDETSTMSEESTVQHESSMLTSKTWNGIAKDELPARNYSEELAVSIAIPAVIFSFVVALLTIILCFHHEKFEQPKSKEPVQMVQYSGTNKTPPTTTLKSLHDPYSDNLSLDSDSPSTNIFQEGSPKLNAYYRPNPPAYTGKITFQGPSTSTVRFDKDI
ncbi:unnamed protein product [Chironomus riparius]|uniref:Epsilon-sarcoglycan n=1 Tax=Chironomus riparius TaxID=315576 RepID=A0A9P0IJ20_9DIPT|nr:unnamed protein product [Chironomus riparius]